MIETHSYHSSPPSGGRNYFRSFSLFIFVFFVFFNIGNTFAVCTIDKGEQVIFFPSIAYSTTDGLSWVVNVHGWIFRDEPDSRVRRAVLATLIRTLGLSQEEQELPFFKERVRSFLVHNQDRRRLEIRIGDKVFPLKASDGSGHFQDQWVVPKRDLKRSPWVRSEVSCGGQTTIAATKIWFSDDRGLAVISDIDDTIKVTEVTHRRALLANTFLRDFQAVPGMPAAYATWAKKDPTMSFYYVSASPWQLFTGLSVFLEKQGFPEGILYLKRFRLKDRSVLNLFQSPEKYKPPILEDLFQRFPHRKYILIGDSGEKDPEIYGSFARRYPSQIEHIFIRELAPAPEEARFKTAFRAIPLSKWSYFRDSKVLQNWWVQS